MTQEVPALPVLYTVAQVAQMVQCSQKTVRRAIDRGELKVVRFGRMVRIPQSELQGRLPA